MFRYALAAGIALMIVSTAMAAPLDDAIALYKVKKIPEARAALEKITAAEPTNAEACYYLGLTLVRTHDPALLETAVNWLKQAAELQPDNTTYLFEYGGNSLNLAGKTRSLGAANRGRDALEKVIKLDPAHLNAREALYQFYDQAPWPIGSSSKANAQLDEIRKRDPNRALTLVVAAKTKSKDYNEAFTLCEQALAKTPNDYIVPLLYAHVAIASGQNLDLALSRLNKCLTLTPPPIPGGPGPAFVHWRIGNLQEKKGDKPAARAAYEESLKADPSFAPARNALEKLN
jgi:tetratricopeptide (TPR) repeat protein